MDTQEGHSTALLGAETMDRRGVWVRKPMFEPDWENVLLAQGARTVDEIEDRDHSRKARTNGT